MPEASKLAPKCGILEIDPYVPGKSHLPATGSDGAPLQVIKLSSNETPFGPSPKAIDAYQQAAAKLFRYPDGSSTILRQAIAKHYGLNPDNIVCGAGSDELLNLLAHAYLNPGDEGIYTEHGFLVYKIAILGNSGTPVVAPEKNLTADVDAILERVTERTKIVFIANPNNPTGTYIPIEEVRRLRAGLPDQVLLVLDGAYAEYVRRNDYEAGFELVATTNNTVMTRTFSKVYGLASLRIGWAYCPKDVADVLNRIRGPFNLSGPALEAGVAAIQDQEHIAKSVAHNEKWLAVLTSEITKLGLTVTPSVANFITIHFPKDDKKGADAADEFLNNKGIILRRIKAYGLPDALRMTVGLAEENEAVLAALREFMGRPSS